MKRRPALFTLSLLGAATVGGADAAEASAGLRISVSLKPAPKATAPTFVVKITNVSKSPLRLNHLESRRGWDALRLQLIDSSGAALWMHRRQRDWTGPSHEISLKPNEDLVTEISPSDTDWTWPVSFGAGRVQRVIAHLDQPAQSAAGFWCGHIQSPPLILPQTLGESFPSLAD